MDLCKTNEAFFYKDHVLDDQTYRIFNYRLASYTDFLLPAALECRGHMFNITVEDRPIVVCLPMQKFFNANENLMTTDLDFSNAKSIMDKRDDSLISTYIHKGDVALKTKGSLTSDQAIAGTKWLNLVPALKKELYDYTLTSFTVNLEWTAPDNRIVLNYKEPSLRILNIRSMIDGAYLDKEDIKKTAPMMYGLWVDLENEHLDDMDTFVNDIVNHTHKEGYVIQFDNGSLVKIKTEWYMIRHRVKDSINYDKHLIEAIVTESIDDVMSLFHDDQDTLDRINSMVAKVVPSFNHLMETIEKFYDDHKDDDRKTYAIASKELPDGYISLCMTMYDHKEPDYRKFYMRNYERFIV